MQRTITREANTNLVGSRQQVLIEGNSKQAGQVYGRTSCNKIVNIAAESLQQGDLVEVVVTKGFQNSLVARCIDSGDAAVNDRQGLPDDGGGS